MRRSHPTAFVLKKRDSCAVCNNIAPCPVCPKGQQCQQIFRSSCQDCPVNKCVPIPGYSANGGTNKSALGGGLAALFIVTLAAGTAFWFWRRLKAKRRRIALHEEAMERREKLRNEKEAMTLQLGGAKSARTPTDSTSPFAIVDDDDLLDNDTEYTQVTGVLNNNDQNRLGSPAEPTAFRRRSFGAATHLSRITEGAEEEEEEQTPNNASAAGHRKRNTVGSIQSTARSFASGAGPRISIASGTSSFGSHNIIPIAFKPSPSNAAAPSATAASDADGENGVDRADDASLAGYQSISPLALPSTAHRATGAPAIQVNTARRGPVRPTRAPDLNLRLPEPHKPATSSPLAQSSAHNITPASTAAAAGQPAYQFMSIDPVEALKSSGPYSRSDRPLSGATINTIGSTHSGSLSYVLSAPQVITPVSGEGVRRVQLGNGGKAQLVKVPSLKRKDSKKGDKPAGGREDPFHDPNENTQDSELLPPPSNRFNSKNDSSRLSTNSTSTLGIPFGENPFGPSPFTPHPPNQASPSDAEDHRSSWLGGGDDDDSSLSSRTTARDAADPFRDPTSISRPPTVHSGRGEGEGEGEDEPRTSIGGVSLGQFPFDVPKGLPENALQRVEEFR
ncbi:uncharacterized protein SPSC_05025 [Sporisorium scitamineum]|uniref:Membrane anchor Opy2 N-terminal domain-containing protein n=1 Tax=Sporisorium scitamineum TaxID=49012 RepID=A0A0F7SCW7_9BASI|nr:uncharacterized protein SPSC_05025 [Sporisorium scitamineum]CDW99225.1 hypothetical protein [Sporisorium scitamineum]